MDHEHVITHLDDDAWVYVIPGDPDAPQMARELLALAEKMFGPENAKWMVNTNSDDGLSFRVPESLADRYLSPELLLSPPALGDFDPGIYTVGDVIAHLEVSDHEERLRVIEQERAGKSRKSILGWLDA